MYTHTHTHTHTVSVSVVQWSRRQLSGCTVLHHVPQTMKVKPKVQLKTTSLQQTEQSTNRFSDLCDFFLNFRQRRTAQFPLLGDLSEAWECFQMLTRSALLMEKGQNA